MLEAQHVTPASRIGAVILLSAVFAAAACAIIYQLLIGTLSSYFLGDSVEQFSLTIGFFLAAMGLGSWASRLFHRGLLAIFVALELSLGLVGGCSVPLLYAVYAYGGPYRYCMILSIIAVGSLIGLELPLLARILREFGSLRKVLADALSVDYFGSLLAALLFPYVLLPLLGTFHTSLAAGAINAAVGVGLLLVFRGALSTPQVRKLAVLALSVVLGLSTLVVHGESLREQWESNLYNDRIVYSHQSRYQRIVLTQWQDDLRLYLDGHLQFSSADEYRYHEALVHPAMSLARSRSRVLILGGGDGLSAREVLKYPDVDLIELIDLDPAVTDLARRDVRLTGLNRNALNQPKVRILNEDAFQFLQRAHEPYGVIIADLPDPRVDALTKLYSVEGYRLLERHLAPGGLCATQATSPYYARRTFWSVGRTLAEAGLRTVPYHIPVPSFGEWGFFLASDSSGVATPGHVARANIGVPVRHLRPEVLRQALIFPADMERTEVEANRLDRPLLARYYREDWSAW